MKPILKETRAYQKPLSASCFICVIFKRSFLVICVVIIEFRKGSFTAWVVRPFKYSNEVFSELLTSSVESECF